MRSHIDKAEIRPTFSQTIRESTRREYFKDTGGAAGHTNKKRQEYIRKSHTIKLLQTLMRKKRVRVLLLAKRNIQYRYN